MKIIDFDKKGNIVRFYLGADDLPDWHGDDWNDAPYEHNAGLVYDEYIAGHRDIAFPFDALVIEPCEGEFNCPWRKDDMKARKVPCIIVVPADKAEDSWYGNNFSYWVGMDGIQKFYFGDKMEPEASQTIQPDAPRVMTLQEILEAKRPFYIEKQSCEDGDKEWRGWGLMEYVDAGQVLFVVMGKDLRLLCEISTMGRFFRCWTSRPTEEQMEATPWVD